MGNSVTPEPFRLGSCMLEFQGAIWSNFCNQHNINHHTTNPGSPTENAFVERTNRTIRNKLNEMMLRNNSNEWLAHVQTVCDSINNNVVSGTGYTPNKMWVSGYQAGHQPLPEDLPPPSDNDNKRMIRDRMMETWSSIFELAVYSIHTRTVIIYIYIYIYISLACSKTTSLASLAYPPNPYKKLPPERRNKRPGLRRYIFIS
jgi:hypothetical protein